MNTETIAYTIPAYLKEKTEKIMEASIPEAQPQPVPEVIPPYKSDASYSLIKIQAFHIQAGQNIGIVISDGAGGGLLHPRMFKVKMVRRDGKIILRPAYKKG